MKKLILKYNLAYVSNLVDFMGFNTVYILIVKKPGNG